MTNVCVARGKNENLVVITTVCVAREKYESLVEKESRKSQLNSVGHNHSHDSAIDADLQEWELETLHFEIVSLHLCLDCHQTVSCHVQCPVDSSSLEHTCL